MGVGDTQVRHCQVRVNGNYTIEGDERLLCVAIGEMGSPQCVKHLNIVGQHCSGFLGCCYSILDLLLPGQYIDQLQARPCFVRRQPDRLGQRSLHFLRWNARLNSQVRKAGSSNVIPWVSLQEGLGACSGLFRLAISKVHLCQRNHARNKARLQSNGLFER